MMASQSSNVCYEGSSGVHDSAPGCDVPQVPGESHIFSACEDEDLDAVTLALTSGADLGSTDAAGNTVIHVLAARGHHHILSEVIQYTGTGEKSNASTDFTTRNSQKETKNNTFPLDLESQNEAGLTPLMLACYYGNLETVKILLAAGANPNTTSESQFSWLHRVALGGEDGMMMLALNNYADGNVTDKHGRTPLHHACGSGNEKVVTFLLVSHNTNVDIDIQDNDGYSSLMYAVAQGNIKSIQKLFEWDCDVSLTAKNGQTAACFIDSVDDIRTKEIIAGKVSCQCDEPSEKHTFKPKPLPTEIIAILGDQALHVTLASPHYNPELLKILTNHMPDLNIRNAFGHSPLGLASIFNRIDFFDLCEKQNCLKQGINQCDCIGFTPVMYAAGYGTLEIMSRLIKNGCDICWASYAKTLALHVACVLDKPDNLDILLKNGADISSADENGAQPLHESIYFSFNCFRVIMNKHQPDVNSILPDSRTALHFASYKNKYEMVEMLLEADALVNIATIMGDTPLHYAVLSTEGCESVGLLLGKGKGAEVDAENAVGRTALWIAAKHGQLDILPVLLENGADKNKADTEKVSPLMAACLGNQPACVRYLIEEGAEMEKCDKYNRTELDIACSLGHHSLVKLLLDSHDYKPQSLKEPLLRAAMGGFENILVALIQYDATDINGQDDEGKTALYKALENGNSDCARLLIEAGADIHCQTIKKRQALHVASAEGLYDMVKLLIEKGADCNALDTDNDSALYISASKGHAELVDLLLKYTDKDIVNTKVSKTGHNPLLIAARRGKTDICKKLLDAGADAASVTDENFSPLHIAASENHTETIKLFLGYENTIIDALNMYFETPLYVACSTNHADPADMLIKQGADVNFQKFPCGTSPIHIASNNRHVEIVKVLLENGADVNKEMNDGRTAFHIASSNGCIDLMKELINAGAQIDSTNTKGLTPLYFAATAGRAEACALLCQCLDKKGINCPGPDGVTPLMIAAQGGHTGCCKILLDSGADFNCTDSYGHTALHFACIPQSPTFQKDPLECVSLLLDRGIDLEKQGAGKKTALLIAAEYQNVPAALLLISKNSDLSSTDSSGDNILHIASSLNCIEVVRSVLDLEMSRFNICDLNAGKGEKGALFRRLFSLSSYAMKENKLGLTPLHCACVHGNGDIAALLLEYGAIVLEHQMSPVVLAARNKYLDVVRLLMKHRKMSSAEISEIIKLYKNGEIYGKIAHMCGHPEALKNTAETAENIWHTIQKYHTVCLERKRFSFVYYTTFHQELASFSNLIDAQKTDEADNVRTLSSSLMESIVCDMQKVLSHTVSYSLSGSCKTGWKTGSLDEFDFLVDIQVDDLNNLGDRDMKEWLYTYLLEILPDEADEHESLKGEVKILGINRSRSAPCVNFTIGWKCGNGHIHEINFDVTIAARLSNSKTEEKFNLMHLSFKTPFTNYWQDICDIPLIYVPIRENASSTWAESLVIADSLMKEKVSSSHPNIKDVMLILKFLRDLIFPRVLKYSPKRTSYKSNGKDGDLISSHIIQHLMYMELIKCPSNKEWAKSKLTDRVLSILSTMGSGQYTDLYKDSKKSILNTPFSDKENLMVWLRKDVQLISSTFRELTERYKQPTLPDIKRLSAIIDENRDKVYIIDGDKLKQIGREELYYKPDIRESLGLSPYSNIYYYLPPTLDDYEKQRPITAKIAMKRYQSFKDFDS